MEGRRGSKVELLTRYSISTSDSTTRTSFALTFRLLAATQHPVQRRPAGQSPTTVIERRVDGAPGFARRFWYWPGGVLWPLPRPLVKRICPGQNLLQRKVERGFRFRTLVPGQRPISPKTATNAPSTAYQVSSGASGISPDAAMRVEQLERRAGGLDEAARVACLRGSADVLFSSHPGQCDEIYLAQLRPQGLSQAVAVQPGKHLFGEDHRRTEAARLLQGPWTVVGHLGLVAPKSEQQQEYPPRHSWGQRPEYARSPCLFLRMGV